MSYKSFGAFFTHPIFDFFWFVACGVLLWSVYKEFRAAKEKKAAQKAA
jgi:putative tricarboxylic transport membrane protein